MDKQELITHHNKLNDFYNDFYFKNRDYSHGKNKKIRDNAYEDLKRILSTFENYIFKNLSLYFMMTDQGGTNSDYYRAIMFEEFISIKYFENDLEDFLKKLDELIKGIN